MKDKKIKFYFTGRDYGYFVNLWDVPSDFTEFKKNFILLFKGSQQATAQKNMEIIESIYWDNYAHPDGFYDNAFNAFFNDDKFYHKIKRMIASDKFTKKQFWQLGIL